MICVAAFALRRLHAMHELYHSRIEFLAPIIQYFFDNSDSVWFVLQIWTPSSCSNFTISRVTLCWRGRIIGYRVSGDRLSAFTSRLLLYISPSSSKQGLRTSNLLLQGKCLWLIIALYFSENIFCWHAFMMIISDSWISSLWSSPLIRQLLIKRWTQACIHTSLFQSEYLLGSNLSGKQTNYNQQLKMLIRLPPADSTFFYLRWWWQSLFNNTTWPAFLFRWQEFWTSPPELF